MAAGPALTGSNKDVVMYPMPLPGSGHSR